MSSQDPSTRNTSSRGTGRRGRGRGNRGSHQGGKASIPDVPVHGKQEGKAEEAVEAKEVQVAPSEAEDQDICWICAEPVKYYSVSGCNHRTCHVCALRLRALYKRNDCTFCKESQPNVIFTTSSDTPFESFGPESIPYNDPKLSISFENKEMMEETLILLRFNCPDPDCDYIGNGWADLKLHVRASHGKMLCDLCIRFKKVFAHEHALYPPSILPLHLPSMHQRANKKDFPADQIEGGVHPLCEFCRECFFSSDELYPHMRERHEECFICKRNDVRDQYFQNYESLEKHFHSIHYACQNKECLVHKFVVFNTPLDLQAHMVEEHGADMSSRDRKNAQRVQAAFTFEEVGRQGRRPPRDHEPQQPARQQQPPAASSSSTPGPSRPATGTNARRAAFGSSLTVDQPSNQASQRNSPAASRPATPPDRNVDPATAERHASFIEKLESFAPNPTSAVPAVKAASRGYISNESSAKDFILTIWNVLNHNLDHTAGIVNTFVDLLEEEEKKQDLLSSWRGFAIEQRRQFPDLTPNAIGGGYAGITSGRVLNAKNSTASRTSQQSSRQVWDRVARAASSSGDSVHSGSGSTTLAPRPPDRFPSLGGPSNSNNAGPTPAYRQGQRTTPWSASASGVRVTPKPAGPTSVNVRREPARPPPALSKSAFPELPSSSSWKSRPQVRGNISLKNILGTSSGPSVPAWQSGGDVGDEQAESGAGPAEGRAEDAELSAGNGGGKGKKKGKQKQTLFTLGSFPT